MDSLVSLRTNDTHARINEHARNDAHVTNDVGGEDGACGKACSVRTLHEDGAEEARGSTMRVALREPRRQDISEQHLAHSPFRSWCRVCVAAKAKHPLHKGVRDAEGVEEAVASFHMYYCSMWDDEFDGNVSVVNCKERNTKL